MQAYKAILTRLKGWNKQCLYRAKMKKEREKEIQKELEDLLEDGMGCDFCDLIKIEDPNETIHKQSQTFRAGRSVKYNK